MTTNPKTYAWFIKPGLCYKITTDTETSGEEEVFLAIFGEPYSLVDDEEETDCDAEWKSIKFEWVTQPGPDRDRTLFLQESVEGGKSQGFSANLCDDSGGMFFDSLKVEEVTGKVQPNWRPRRVK